MIRVSRSQGDRGLTYIELLVALAVMAVLSSAAIPLMHWNEKRRMEARLRVQLQTMRSAIDQYKKYVDDGMLVQSDVEQMGYPLDLDELVEGVEVGDPQSPDSQTIKFLREVPVDPFTGEAEWGLRSYQDDFDSKSWGGENVYDVYSLSELRALDDTFYKDW